MNKKEFLSIIKSEVKDKDKPIRLVIRPKRGDRLKLGCGITLVTPADKRETIFISNAFSRKRPIMTVNQFIEQFPIENVYDNFSITAMINYFNGKSNGSLVLHELTDNDGMVIIENKNLVNILIYLEYIR